MTSKGRRERGRGEDKEGAFKRVIDVNILEIKNGNLVSLKDLHTSKSTSFILVTVRSTFLDLFLLPLSLVADEFQVPK